MNGQESARFSRYIGIDYSGAETAESSLKGLRVYLARSEGEPTEVLPPPGPRRYWTRRGLAHWLAELLTDGLPTIIGIDHAFSFPIRYFERHEVEPDWDTFLDDFCAHWPTDEPHTYVDFVRDGRVGQGAARGGETRWRRLCEERTRAKSVFHFDVQGQVAKSSHAGIPWLRFLRRHAELKLHFWPFDGWRPAAGTSVVAEVYPALWKHAFPIEGRTPDQHDAYSVAAWLQHADRSGALARYFEPPVSDHDRAVAEVEGWILGLLGEPEGAASKRQEASSGSVRATNKVPHVRPSSGKVFVDLGHSEAEAQVLALRADLAAQLAKQMTTRRISLPAAAALLNLSQERVLELMRGSAGQFTLNELILFAAKLGKPVTIRLAR